MRKCSNPACGTLWLDPAPAEKDLTMLYANYSTHIEGVAVNVAAIKRPLLNRIRESYLFAQYGYDSPPLTFSDKALGLLAYLHPAWKDTQAANIFYIPFKKNGKFLDVGCGSGSAMETMRKMGWQVQGIDFDEAAIKLAKGKGLDVCVGDLESQNFPDNSFDSILLNHVIEHLPSPFRIFKECRRILKPGGTLVIITPNANARGHAIYKRNWRGLETPHHLQVFTPQALALLGGKAGFSNIKGFSSLQGVFYILGQSNELTKKAILDPYSSSYLKSFIYRPTIKHLLWFVLGWTHILLPGRDEVAVVICSK